MPAQSFRLFSVYIAAEFEAFKAVLTVFSGNPTVYLIGNYGNDDEIVINPTKNSNFPYVFQISSAELATFGLNTEKYTLKIDSGTRDTQSILRITLENDYKLTQIGVPVTSYLSFGSQDAFLVHLNPVFTRKTVTVGLFLYTGDAEMTVKICPSPFICPAKTDVFALKPQKDGIETIEIGLFPSNCPESNCYMQLLVENTGETSALATVVCVDTEALVVLREGEGLQYVVGKGDGVRFGYEDMGNQVDVRYVGVDGKIETFRGNHEMVSVTIKAENEPRGFSLCALGISEDRRSQWMDLRPGMSVAGLIDLNSTSFHAIHYHLPPLPTASSVVVTPLYGVFAVTYATLDTLYVSHYTVNNTISIPASTSPSVLTVKLDGTDSFGRFNIHLHTGTVPISLLSGQPLVNSVAKQDFHTYKFAIIHPCNVSIDLTSLSGDPDLSLSILQNELLYDSIGGNSVSLEWENSLERLCNGTVPCYMYVRVQGYTVAVYALTLRNTQDQPQFLTVGKPQIGHGSRTYFSYVNTKKSLQFSLQTLSGDCKFQTKLTPSWSFFLSNPDLESFTSQTWNIHQHLSIPREMLSDTCVNLTVCIGVVQVKCESEASRYVIYGDQGVVVLSEGAVCLLGAAEEGFTSVLLYNTQGREDIHLQSRVLSGHGVTWYATQGLVLDSNVSSYNWTFDDSADIHLNSDIRSGYYSLLMVARQQTASELMYKSSPTSSTYISTGEAVSGHMESHHAAYYVYEVDTDRDVTVSITPLIGKVEVYVSTSQADFDLPNSKENYWKSCESHSMQEIYISKDDPHFCVSCSLIISVESSEPAETYFILQVSSPSNRIVLLNGVPVSGYLPQGETQVYLFSAYTPGAVSVLSTAYTGSLSLYIHPTSDVKTTHYTWSTPASHLVISPYDPNYHPGNLYILLQATQTSSYVLTTHIQNSVIQLLDGWMQVYSLANVQENGLIFDYQAHEGLAQCHFRPLNHVFRPNISLSFHPYDFTNSSNLTSMKYAFGEIFIQQSGFSPGRLRINVSGNGNNWIQSIIFSLVCHCNSSPIHLQAGERVFGFLTSTWKEARYIVRSELAGALLVRVETCGVQLELIVANGNIINSHSGLNLAVSMEINQSDVVEIGVKMKEISEETAFRVYTEFFRGEEEVEEMKAGGNGEISWTQISSHRVEFLWSAPVYVTNSSVPNSTIVYRAYSSKYGKKALETGCSVGLGELDDTVQVLDMPLLLGQTTFRLYINSTDALYVTILAYVNHLEIAYSPVEVQLRAYGTHVPWWGKLTLLLVGVGIVTAVVVAVGTGLVRKGKRPTLQVSNPDVSVVEPARVREQYGELDED